MITRRRLIWKVTKWTLATFGVLLVCLLLLIGGAYTYYAMSGYGKNGLLPESRG